MRRKHWVCGMLLALLLVVGPGTSPATAKDIVIGAIGGLSGMGYLTTKPCFDGIKLAVKEINDAGGILGDKIELLERDDELKVDVGVREMTSLIMQKKVDAVIGGLASHVILAQSEVAKRFKTPFLVVMGNSQKITEAKGHPYVFQLVPNTRMEATALAIFTSKQGWKKVWTVAPDYEWGHTFTDLYLQKLKELVPDLEVLGESWPKLGESDFSPYITSIVNAKPEFVFNILWGADLINFTKQAKPYGLYDKMAASGLYDLNQLRALGDEMPAGVVGFNRGEFFCVDTPGMKDFVARYQKEYGEYPTAYSVFGYEAVYSLKQAMEKAGSTDREKVAAALSGMEFTGPRGKLHFRDYDNMVNGSIYVGFSTKTDAYPFYTYKDIMAVPGESTWLPVDAIKKLREAEK